jgi:hypothetical protein
MLGRWARRARSDFMTLIHTKLVTDLRSFVAVSNFSSLA